nr:hypothetical COI intron protein 361 - Allomyces macrogynus mitochondrion [Allomyces macrogynus]
HWMARNSCEIILYFSTVCWDFLLLSLCTKIVIGTNSGTYFEDILKFLYSFEFFQIIFISLTCLVVLEVEYIVPPKFPSLVKTIRHRKPAGNILSASDGQSNEDDITDTIKYSSSETTCATFYDNDFDQFGHWLAGLIDGDGSMYVSSTGQPEIEITLHEEDVKTLHKIQYILGVGSVSKRENTKATYRFRVRDKAGCILIISLINGKLLTPGKHDQLIKMCGALDIVPITDNTFSIDNAWFSGFFDAEGYISVRNKYTLTLSVSQKHKDILEQICTGFGCGNIYYDKSWDGYNYAITKRAESHHILLDYFAKFPLLTVKYVDIITFKQLLHYVELGYHLSKSPYKSKIDHLFTLFRNRKKV